MEKIKSNPIAEFTHPAPLHTPVLFLVFNRPDTTRQVFDAIRQAQPPRLYVAADGPRANREGEAERCQQVRDIATQVDWDCEVKTLFREENLGCRVAVSGAIDWFFENEEMGIILEDDCLPSPSWFPFAQELLERYREDERIMCISAQHPHGKEHQPTHSYYFSIYNHCWGWASWRRAWQHYNHEMKDWPALRETLWLREVGNGSWLFERNWKRIFDNCYANKIDSWAYRWTFSCWGQNALTIIPAKNLIKNIGFDKEATHTKNPNHLRAQFNLEELSSPLNKPTLVIPDLYADLWAQRWIYDVCMLQEFKFCIREIPVLGKLTTYIYQHIKNIKREIS